MDTLNDIHGLGIAAEVRLRRVGITSSNRLAEASPEQIREILGYLAQESSVELWIAHAQVLAREPAP